MLRHMIRPGVRRRLLKNELDIQLGSQPRPPPPRPCSPMGQFGVEILRREVIELPLTLRSTVSGFEVLAPTRWRMTSARNGGTHRLTDMQSGLASVWLRDNGQCVQNMPRHLW